MLAFADETAADETAAAFVRKKSWPRRGGGTWGIEVIVVDLPADAREGLNAAQLRQVMTNPDLLD